MTAEWPTNDPGATRADLDQTLIALAARRRPARASRSSVLQLGQRQARMARYCRSIEKALAAGRTASRAEEWLLDNQHVVEDALAGLSQDVPAGFVRSLPQLEAPGGARAPPVIAELARILVDHGGQPIDPAWLEQAIERYQVHQPLTIGELWAIPAYIALVIIDQLLDVSERISASPQAHTPEQEIILTDAVAGAIISLRTLASHSWPDSFERLCLVDRRLAEDPAGAYPEMDFDSRDRYRRVVEQLARGCRLSEVEVADQCIQFSHRARYGKQRHRHVGYWLIGSGRLRLEAAIGFRLDARQRLLRFADQHPGLVYFSLLGLIGAIPVAMLGSFLWYHQAPAALAVVTLLLALVPISGLAVVLVNGLVTWLVPPRTLARMSFEQGIPGEYRTAVVMPIIFSSTADVDHAFERLEVNFLANDDPSLVFVVLGDLYDAPQSHAPGDDRILWQARIQIRRLSRLYGRGCFLFLSRARRWNEAQDCWMGWERKRGKLMEFNRLLGGAGDTSYDTVWGESELLEGIRYVITLDADTRLPPGSARQLVGTLAHPLSRAVYDRTNGTLKAGFSIIQPRLEVDPESTHATVFTKVFSGDITIDLYTHASSDVYHDLFGEGIFTGKGIYDWRALEFTLADRIPENSLLSHDLLEGIHGRVGLASDIVLMEQFPASVIAFMRRQHRWVRGDWQLLPWLKRRVRTARPERRRNVLKSIHRWKIVDNLRRSLQPPVVLALVLLSFTGLLPGHGWLWALLFSALLAAGLVSETLDIATRSLASPASAPRRLRQAPRVLMRQFQFWLLSLVLLPYKSLILVDAIVRTLFRMLVTRRHLLEWTTAAHVQRDLGKARRALWRELWVAPTLAVIATTLIIAFNRSALPAAMPLLVGWLLAPLIARQIERVRIRKAPELDAAARDLLRRVGRRTWLFFDRFVGPDTHWLPPDNYQEDPRVVLAQRTSPTNIGMALNSALAAHDFGWIDSLTLVAWLRNSMEGMHNLERHRGHWLNWYEIRDLRRLEPAYVSTVDSGNLAVSLVTLARGLDEMGRTPVNPALLVRGISDTLDVIAETIEALPGVVPAHKSSRNILTTIKRLRKELITVAPENSWRELERWHEQLFNELAEKVARLAEAENVVVSAEAIAEFRIWLAELGRQIERARNTILELQPWLAEFPPLPEPGRFTEAVDADCKQLSRILLGEWTLNLWSSRHKRAIQLLDQIETSLAAADGTNDFSDTLDRLREQLDQARDAATNLRTEVRALSKLADTWVGEMDFRFLYDVDRHLFRIGYDVSNASPDPNYYDLLASESRLAGLLAIARGQVPVKHWLHLGRPFRRRGGRSILMSWGATLFEYLMPRLYTRSPVNSLLYNASHTAIKMHREFAEHYKIPWGISESAYYQLDEQQHYAYRAFGVPGLGFRRDLGERLVVSPYSSIMALPFDVEAVVTNLRRFKSLRAIGLYGCYEAVDFGRRTKPQPRRSRIVRAWMSHHQGMVLLAIDNCLNSDVMVRRFHEDPHVAGVSMLLHERLPHTVPRIAARTRKPELRTLRIAADPVSWRGEIRPPVAQYSVLSNGHYSVFVNSDGGGGSIWQGIALNRWQPDATTNAWGHWIYVKDLDSGELFSVSADPCGEESGERVAVQGPHMAQFRCRRDQLLCRMHMAVAAQHDVEARRLLISNESSRPRRLVVASFAELAMAPARDFERHPAFARLFVESDCLPAENALLFRRRPRSSEEKPLYLAHMLVVPPGVDSRFGWETDRFRFIGRGGSVQLPAGLEDGLDSLSGRTGAVVDPAIASAVEFRLEPFGRLELGLLTGAGRSRRELLGALRSYRGQGRIDWLFEQARMQTSQELEYLQIPPLQVQPVMQLMSAMLEPNPAWRHAHHKPSEPLQSLLWSRGISGDWPIIVVEVQVNSGLEQVAEIIRAHTLLAGRQVRSDLVLIDEAAAGYEQLSRDRLYEMSEAIRGRIQRFLAGNVTIIAGRELSAPQRQALKSAAAVVFKADNPSLVDQLHPDPHRLLPPLIPTRAPPEREGKTAVLKQPDDLQFDNGIGGFSADGREYVMHLEPGRHTPAPWSNVLANPDFGSLVTESGTSFTWAGNSSEYRLTPWPNDPVQDISGEVIYLRDEETGRVWTPTPSPRPGQGAYQVRHGAGRTTFLHNGQQLIQRYRVHVDPVFPVKICSLELTNTADRTRRITATCYLEWVLGNRRGESAMHLESDLALEYRALLVRNTFDRFASSRHAFVASSLPIHSFTTDRTEFLGQGGSTRQPTAMWRIGLSGMLAAGTDPCAALMSHMDIPPGQTRTVCFVIGHGESRDQAVELAASFANEQSAESSNQRLEAHWQNLLGKVQVHTPDPSMNLLLNLWLPYQTIGARLWGRTGYYQSSGGMGFRDQLQDVMALIWLDPAMVRKQILLAAGRQFPEGDVLHWWHESPLRGVRTRCSDDLLWLPLVTAFYVRASGDTGIFKESIAYLDGPELSAEESERYAEYAQGPRVESLYQHCCRAIDRASQVGPHGLPIIGNGDWNDGFNRVSTTGRGESVWMAWFLIRVLNDFSACCVQQNDPDVAQQYRQLARQLAQRVEAEAWDGKWYRRAYYDDGTALGSAESDECQIDLIAQAWSVIGPEQPAPRAEMAMISAMDRLVDPVDRLILLLDPPFNRGRKDPGYIKGYPPGIRENGAQYTHAATWAVWAAAALGWEDRAHELFKLLDPIRRSATSEDMQRYAVEPYVLAGDIYSQGDNRGRGGWSWYSGAAAWLYRAGLEALLGLQLDNEHLVINPCLPPDWPECRVQLQLQESSYDIVLTRESTKDGEARIEVTVDGQVQESNRIRLSKDGAKHQVQVRIISRPPSRRRSDQLKSAP